MGNFMSLKRLKKLAFFTAVVASTMGLFAESAKAQQAGQPGFLDSFGRFNHFTQSPGPDIKLNNQELEASFDVVTDQSFDNAVENFSLINSTTGETIFTSNTGSIVQREFLETENELNNFLTSLGLNEFGIGRDQVFENIPGDEPIAAYVLNLDNQLNPNEQATLTLFYDNSKATFPRENGLQNLVNSPQGVSSYVGDNTVPAVLLRDSRDGLDKPENIVDGRTVDKFGVGPDAPLSQPFSVAFVEPTGNSATVPEPYTGSALFVVGALGGLLTVKRNLRVKKHTVSIEK